MDAYGISEQGRDAANIVRYDAGSTSECVKEPIRNKTILFHVKPMIG